MQADVQKIMQVDPVWLREKAAAQRIGIKPSTLWLYVRRGWIKSIKLSPKVTVFAVADLDAFVQSRMNIA